MGEGEERGLVRCDGRRWDCEYYGDRGGDEWGERKGREVEEREITKEGFWQMEWTEVSETDSEILLSIHVDKEEEIKEWVLVVILSLRYSFEALWRVLWRAFGMTS